MSLLPSLRFYFCVTKSRSSLPIKSFGHSFSLLLCVHVQFWWRQWETAMLIVMTMKETTFVSLSRRLTRRPQERWILNPLLAATFHLRAKSDTLSELSRREPKQGETIYVGHRCVFKVRLLLVKTSLPSFCAGFDGVSDSGSESLHQTTFKHFSCYSVLLHELSDVILHSLVWIINSPQGANSNLQTDHHRILFEAAAPLTHAHVHTLDAFALFHSKRRVCTALALLYYEWSGLLVLLTCTLFLIPFTIFDQRRGVLAAVGAATLGFLGRG